jgi:hypothetical protein
LKGSGREAGSIPMLVGMVGIGRLNAVSELAKITPQGRELHLVNGQWGGHLFGSEQITV